MEILNDYCLKKHNTFGIEAKAKQFVAVHSVDELKSVLREHAEINKFILGGGSNMLLTKDIDALVIHIDLKGIKILSEDDDYDKNTIPNAKDFRFGIVVSEWNEKVTEGLYSGAEAALLDCGATPDNIIRWNVPGSFELVYGAKNMIETQHVDVVITIGCVIKGETMHFEFVCEGVTQGIKDLNVQKNVPVIFCVLTDNNEQQSIDRSGGIHGNKGTEAAIAAIKMAELRRVGSSRVSE